ncbi:hypothetical protein HCUR_01456 [Holospora curviuscula]|uniref:Uncharacterized protein n=1 Tax=Holospora curviuscula TaxID=1082868 RepID=A0A2S5R6Z6_9PROT|nr:hypothetical protein HCUR_01456 [Holospora curviuscula]
MCMVVLRFFLNGLLFGLHLVLLLREEGDFDGVGIYHKPVTIGMDNKHNKFLQQLLPDYIVYPRINWRSILFYSP